MAREKVLVRRTPARILDDEQPRLWVAVQPRPNHAELIGLLGCPLHDKGPVGFKQIQQLSAQAGVGAALEPRLQAQIGMLSDGLRANHSSCDDILPHLFHTRTFQICMRK